MKGTIYILDVQRERDKMKAKLTKVDAIRKAKEYGIDFSKDGFELSISDKSYMAELAREMGYKKSSTCCVSTGHAVFIHLKKYL